MKTDKIRKTVYIPVTVCAEIEKIAKEKDRTFTSVASRLLEKAVKKSLHKSLWGDAHEEKK